MPITARPAQGSRARRCACCARPAHAWRLGHILLPSRNAHSAEIRPLLDVPLALPELLQHRPALKKKCT